jgi:uncharacterized membrane protein YqjE
MTTDQSRQVPGTAVPPPGLGVDAADEGSDRSLGEIMGYIASDLSALVRQELELARTELKAEAAKAGKGAGMFGGAGLSALLALIFLSLAATFLLDNWMPTELAALIVAVVWAAAAAVLALRGKKELKKTNPELPVTQQTLKEDVQWAKAQKS